jgi:hypothetical protein
LSEIMYGLEIATFVIVFLGAIYGVTIWFKRREEKREYEKLMEDPLEVHFFIPEKSRYIIKYVNQETEEGKTKDELTIPVNSEDHIFLIIRPKLNLKVSERYFGFGGAMEKKPEIINANNPFTVESSEGLQWSKDWYGCYHIRGEKLYLKGETYLPAFKIKTKEKGDYPLEITYHLCSNEWKDVKKEICKVFNKRLPLKVTEK